MIAGFEPVWHPGRLRDVRHPDQPVYPRSPDRLAVISMGDFLPHECPSGFQGVAVVDPEVFQAFAISQRMEQARSRAPQSPRTRAPQTTTTAADG